MSCKNFPFCLIGCTLFLFVGARMQDAKAVYPDPGVVEAHWRKNPKIFQKAFEMLFPRAKSLRLWSEGFPGWLKDQNGNPCTVKTGSDDLSFHTPDDLEKLSCDADLKKIIKVVGSREFLEKVLSGEVVKSIFAHAISGKDFKTEITFRPRLKKNFFNMFGKGELRMWIEQFFEGSKVLDCDFSFAFEKKNRLTVLTNYDVSYAIAQGGKQRSTGVEFLKKTERLPDFPRNIPGNAKNKFSTVYAKLRDDLKNNRKKHEDFEICSNAEVAQEGLKKSIDAIADNSPIDCVVVSSTASGHQHFAVHMRPSDGFVVSINPSIALLRNKNEISAMSDILVTEDFLEGIFGEEFYNILRYITKSGFRVKFEISEYSGGFKVLFELYGSCCRGNLTGDVVVFTNEPNTWRWLETNYINFVFFYDPEKDEISHVRLQDRLVLNYETLAEGDDLLTVDEDDFERPASFWLEVQGGRYCETLPLCDGRRKDYA